MFMYTFLLNDTNRIPNHISQSMVDSDKGITNFNASNDIILDASMLVVVREGGKQWNRKGDAVECVAVIPDSTYAMFHAEMLADCVKNGQYDVSTMGKYQQLINLK